MNSLQLRRAVKVFGERHLLNVEAHTFSSGEMHLVRGDNGAGKTTLFKMLAGLDKPAMADALEFEFNGNTYTYKHYPDTLRREIVYIHQHPYLFSTTVADNIGYGLRMRSVPSQQRERAVADAIRWAGLSAVERVRPKKLSGGEKQRVALARALVLNAPLMLIDEPTANLDANARDQVKTLLESLRDDGRIVIIATHDPALFALSGAIVWRLADGKLIRPS